MFVGKPVLSQTSLYKAKRELSCGNQPARSDRIKVCLEVYLFVLISNIFRSESIRYRVMFILGAVMFSLELAKTQ